jgi:RNase P protein component
MLSRLHKFPMRTEFLRFRHTSSQGVSPHLRLYSRRVSHQSRLSIVIPLKVNKHAVARNCFRRLLYDAAWSRIKSLNLDCVILLKPLPLPKNPTSLSLLLSELNNLILDH